MRGQGLISFLACSCDDNNFALEYVISHTAQDPQDQDAEMNGDDMFVPV
jgi:hypothetical protein